MLPTFLKSSDHLFSTYIVQMTQAPLTGGSSSSTKTSGTTNSSTSTIAAHTAVLESAFNSTVTPEVLYHYISLFNGFAVQLTEEEAATLSEAQDIQSVAVDSCSKLLTVSSWDLLGLDLPSPTGAWSNAKASDVIVGIFDSGVWPEHASFQDKGMHKSPTHWKGKCNGGKNFKCNRKLIGAKYFRSGYAAAGGSMDLESESARDHLGHGTHTASIAVGRRVERARIKWWVNDTTIYGTASGMAPFARLAVYKVCWKLSQSGENACYSSDVLAALEEAVADGINVASISFGTNTSANYLTDGLSLGALLAAASGITVVASAGNGGPTTSTVTNTAPWLMTVGASTMDRSFENNISLGSSATFIGSSLSNGSFPDWAHRALIYGGDAAAANATFDQARLCMPGSLDQSTSHGKVIICDRGINSRVEKSQTVLLAGAVGMVLLNGALDGSNTVSDFHMLPSINVNFSSGEPIHNYAVNPVSYPPSALISNTTVSRNREAPTITSFSSRGPNPVVPSVLKPDLVAPGAEIFAAWSPDMSPTGQYFDKRSFLYNVISGTSMAAPHVAGVAALIHGAHPSWSPARVRSALMTTAYSSTNRGNGIPDYDGSNAGPFHFGAGHINPNAALNPGLVFDLAYTDYIAFLCAISDPTSVQILTSTVCPTPVPSITNFNYPAIQVKNLTGTTVVSRWVTKVDDGPGSYYAHVDAPPGVWINVIPDSLNFNNGEQSLKFDVYLTRSDLSQSFESPSNAPSPTPAPVISTDGFVFGSIIWKDAEHACKMAIAAELPASQQSLSR